jgi:hypothetical protein
MVLYDNALNLNKIIIDSRFKSTASASDSDFIVELPETVSLPPGTRCYVTEVSLCHSWYSIEEGVNDKLFFSYVKNEQRYDAILTLAASNYTLDSLISHLRDLFRDKLATSPSWVTQGFMPMILPEGATGQLFILNVNVVDTGNFYIWSNDNIQKESFYYAWTGGAYNVSFPGYRNRLLKNFTTQANSTTKPFKSGFIDLLTHHIIYIRSPQLGTFQNIGPQGERDILKKVMVSVPFGDLITDHWLNTEDFTDCSRLTFKTLRFRVTDVYGIPINLHGHHISFSLVFSSSQ